MFHHFDLTNDSQLNDDELDSIEHLKDEQCSDIFFQRCDRDNDHRLFSNEWCDCFKYARNDKTRTNKISNILVLFFSSTM